MMNVSPGRCSLLMGLLVLMLVSLPRYYLGGHDTHLLLLLMVGVAVAALAAFQFRQMSGEQRRSLKPLLWRLGICLVVGIIAMGLWQALFASVTGWPLLLSHGATLGVLLHGLSLWWKPPAVPGA